MPTVGQIEKKTQERVLALLSQRLGYSYLGDWIDRPANSVTVREPSSLPHRGRC